MLPPAARVTVDDRVWRTAVRLLVVAGGIVGLVGAPTVAAAGGAAALLAVYTAACLLLSTFGGLLRPQASGPALPWTVVAGTDLLAFWVAALLLVEVDLFAVALLAPIALGAVHAHELGKEQARSAAGIVVAGLAVILVLGPGPVPTWRDGVALAFTAVLVALATLAGGSIRAAEAASVVDRETVDAFRQAIVTTVSHELRTPLTIIQGLTWALVNRWSQLAETQKLDLVDTLGLNVASLDASILHFLDAGRLTRGEWEIRPEWIDADPLVTRVVAKLEPMLAGHDVQRRVEAGRVWGDEEALFRVLELLLVNSCRFSPPATPIGVRITGTEVGGWEVSVTDRGQGIPPRDLPHVFEPLWRADVQESGVSRGAGLGLAIVAELAQRHGGSVTVRSTRGKGSTFRMSLPPAPPETSP